MGDCGRTLIARFAEAGEVRGLWYEVREGWTSVGEDTTGPVTRLTYGESWHRGVVGLSRTAAMCAGIADVACASTYFSGGDRYLSDLMDELDAAEVPYSFTSVGESGNATFRPAAI